MHELSLVTAIADKALEVVGREGASRLVSVRLLLGVLSCARRESLEFCFSLIAREPPLAGARLEIEDDPLVLTCRGCGARTTRAEALLVCSGCGGGDVDVVGGRELIIASVEVC